MEHDLGDVVSVGIDVSKKTLDVCLRFSNNEVSSLKTINSVSGWSELVKILLLHRVSLCIPIICEATGGYHFGVCLHLKAVGYMVKAINPFILNNFAKMEIRKTKTDKVDARRLADLGYLHPELPLFTATNETIMLKKLSSLRNTYTQLFQKISSTLSSLQDTHIQGVIDLSSQIQLLQETRGQIRKTIRTIDTLLKENPVTKEIISQTGKVHGLSEESFAALIAEMGGDMKRFRNKRQITAFCGLDPSERTSGTSVRGKSRLSKRGSPVLRKILTQVAWGLFMHDADARVYYEKKRKEGKHYFTCLIAIARRFIVRLWTAIRKGERYISGDRINSGSQVTNLAIVN
jgi:transposase